MKLYILCYKICNAGIAKLIKIVTSQNLDYMPHQRYDVAR